MVDVTEFATDPTLEALRQEMVRAEPPSQRVYLGGSAIGKPCERELWYSLRWVLESIYDADTLARFSDGHASEAIVAERLRRVPGLRLWTEQEDGKQYGFEALGGHVRGHLDGILKGLLQQPKTAAIWEHKCTAEKYFRSLKKRKAELGEKNALEHWNATYFGQAQLYMGVSGYKRHYMTVATPGSRELTSVRTDFQPEVYEALIEKAKRIVFSSEAPMRISNKPEGFPCRWCDFKDNCHGTKAARVNCRSCAHSTAQEDGTWRCDYHGKRLSIKDQRAGCPKHLYIPDLLPYADVVDMDQDANTITYMTPGGQKFTNAETNDWGNYQFTSKDLQHLDANVLENTTDFFAGMAVFDKASIKEVVKAKEKPKPVFEEASITNSNG